MVKTIQYGCIESGKLVISNRKRMNEDLRQFKDCDVTVTIKKRGRRSNQFNRYYFGCVLQEIMIELNNRGYKVDSIEDMHTLMKMKFCKENVVSEDGEVILEIPGQTSIMNHFEFAEYVDQVKMWASTCLGIYIPEPNTQSEIKF